MKNLQLHLRSTVSSLLKRLAPALGIILALIVQKSIPDSTQHPAAQKHYYEFVLLILLAVYLVAFLISFFNKNLRASLTYKGPFLAGAGILLTLLNLITAKLALLPVIFFPSFDNILAVFVEQTALLGKCIWYSFRLLLLGVFWGGDSWFYHRGFSWLFKKSLLLD